MTFRAKYITGFNDKGIYLTEYDLNMMLFLYEHRLLSQKQLFEFYLLQLENYNYNSFCNRLNKLEKEGIIKRTRYDLIRRNGIFMYLVELEKKGLDILYLSGYLKKSYSQRVPTSNYEHFLGIKQSVIEAYKVLKDDIFGFAIGVNTSQGGTGEVNDFVYVFDKDKAYEITGISSGNKKEVLSIFKNEEFGVNPEQPRKRIENEYIAYKRAALTSYGHITNYFRDQGYPDDYVTGLYPDWMIIHNKNVYDIEFDTGSERYETLLKKIVNYMELNKKDKHKHIVFIISLDDSMTLRNVTEVQTERLSILKDKIMTGIIDKKTKQNEEDNLVTPGYNFRKDNLDVYVFPLGRTSEIYNKVMKKKRNAGKNSDENLAIKEFFHQNKNTLKLNPIIDDADKRRHNINRTKFEEYDLPLFLFESTKYHEPMLFIPFYLEEGNVRTMDKFCYFGEKIHNGNELNSIYTKAVGIYQTKEEMIHDILSVEGINNADSLLFYCLDEQRFYDVINKEETELINPNQKE